MFDYMDQFQSAAGFKAERPATEDEIRAQVFGDRSIGAKIASIEQSLGVTPKAKKYKYMNALLSMNNKEDSDLLNLLLNDREKYNVVGVEKTWTVEGDFRMFVIYTEVQ